MVLKAKGRKKRLKTGGSNCLPTTRTSSILKTTMFFPHLSFFYCYSYRLLTVCWELLKILIWSCSDFFCGLREKLVNERDINNFMFFRFFITFWCAITTETKNEVNLMLIISTEICTCVVKIQSIQALHNLDFRIFLK